MSQDESLRKKKKDSNEFMKRIVLFKTSLLSGGAEHQLVVLAEMLVSIGYSVTVVTFSDVPDHYSLSDSVERVRIAPRRSSIIKFISIFKYLLRTPMDVLIGFGVRENFLILIPMLFRKGVKVIAGERNATLTSPSFYERIDHLFLYKRADRIVTNSYTQQSYLRSKYPRWSNKLSTIINYTNVNAYTIQDGVINNSIPQIGVFARYSEQKNCKRFAEAVYLIKKSVGPCFMVSWFGDILLKGRVSPVYESFLSLIQEYEIDDVISLHDHIKDVASIINRFDVMCLPSIYEGFSNSLSEYICCGKPVLVSDVSDNGLMVKDGFNGFLFNPYDSESIRDAFLRFFSLSNEQRAIMGHNSRSIAEGLFDRKAYLDSYVSIIES